MIRLLGFMTGSAVTVGTILLVIGFPEFPAERAAASEGAPEPAAQTVAATPGNSEPLDDPDYEAAADDGEPAGATGLSQDTGDHPRTDAAAEPLAEATTGPDVRQEHAAPLELPMPETLPESGDPLWHTFWNPFRSEIAANGFATRLRTVTGIDYRVVRLQPGSYQVAFAYADDNERRSKISQIEHATGLNLPEDAP